MRAVGAIACVLVLAQLGCQSAESGSPTEREDRVPATAALYGGWVRADPGQEGLRVRGTGEMNAVVATREWFVAVGEANGRAAAWTSVDGETWRRASARQAAFQSDAQRQVITDVVSDGLTMVAVGFEQDRRGRSRAVVWTSSDGMRWTRADDQPDLASADFQAMSAVTAGGPGFVAAGWSEFDPRTHEANAAVWTSSDGRVWSRVPHDEDVFGVRGPDGMRDVVAGSHGLIAVGNDGPRAVAWTSADARSWTRLPYEEELFGGEQVIWALTLANSGITGVGYDNSIEGEDEYAVVWSSPDGSRWSRAPIEEAPITLLRGVVATDFGLVAVGYQNVGGHMDAVVWTSPDGVIWTQARADDSVFGGRGNQLAYDVAARAGKVVAVGADYGPPRPAVWTSTE